MNILKLQYNVKAPTGRNISARGNALGLNERTVPIAPRSAANYGDWVAWGKIERSKMEENFHSHLQFLEAGSLMTIDQ